MTVQSKLAQQAVPVANPLAASHKAAPKGKRVREVSGNKKLTIALQLPTAAPQDEIDRTVLSVLAGTRKPLSVQELTALTGAREADVDTVVRAARKDGLRIVRRTKGDKAHGIVRVLGTYKRVQSFLPGLELHVYADGEKTFHGREGTLNVKNGLPVEGVFGLDTREAARTHCRIHDDQQGVRKIPSGLTSRGLARLQGMPVDEADQIPGVVTGYVSLGGDNGKKMQKDLELAAKHDGVKVAKIIGVSVDGTKIDGDYNDGATVENALDMQAHALLNPNGYCVVFRADNTDDAFAQAAEAMNVYPGVKVGNRTLPLLGGSISWGMAESNWTEQSLRRWKRLADAARLRGLIITAATGDDGSTDGTDKATPDAPSCVPGIIGAAGVYVESHDGKTVTEIGVWNDMPLGGATGGGISATFGQEAEEKELGLPNSASTGKPGHCSSLIADVAAPASGPNVYYKGKPSPVGGTSHSAPFLCIKLALVQGGLKNRIPDVIGFCYKHADRGIYRQVTTEGHNGDYHVKPTDRFGVPTGFGVLDWSKFNAVAREVQDGVVATAA